MKKEEFKKNPVNEANIRGLHQGSDGSIEGPTRRLVAVKVIVKVHLTTFAPQGKLESCCFAT